MFKFIFLLLVSSSAFADEWTRADSYREATYLTLLAMDWSQSRYIAKHPECNRGQTTPCLHEQNSLLGEHPSRKRVDNYFLLSALLHVVIANALPSGLRVPFQYVSIGWEAGVVAHNYHIGVGVEF